MADRKIQGGEYLLKINDDTLVCLTSVSVNDSVSVVDASSACGPDKSPGSLEISISFEGQHLQDPSTGKISGTDLRQLLRGETTVSFELGPVNPLPNDEIQSGTGFISELSSTYAFDSVGTFSGTLQIYGLPTTTLEGVDIGDFIDGGFVCYIDPLSTYYYVCKDLGQRNWADQDNIATGATGPLLGDGITNTQTIISVLTQPNAAQSCVNLGAGWFLPSVEDIQESIIENFLEVPPFSNTGSWQILTSTETNATSFEMVNLIIINPISPIILTNDIQPFPKSGLYNLFAFKKNLIN